jgi:hypothetical protein
MSDFRIMNRVRISRRQLLGAAASTAVASVVLAREANKPGDASGLSGSNDGGSPVGPARDERNEIAAWLDGMLSGDDLVHARATLTHATLAHATRLSAPVARDTTAPPLQPTVLEHDLLWQWRRDLAQQMRQGVRAIAITRWDKAILLKGLAREATLPVRQSRITRSLFQTEIG